MNEIPLKRIPSGLIIIETVIYGANNNNSRRINLALDTGASITSVRSKTLSDLKYDVLNPKESRQFFTGNGSIEMRCVELSMLQMLGHDFKNMLVGVFELPEDEYIDGLLGQDILSNLDIVINTTKNKILTRRIKTQEVIITP